MVQIHGRRIYLGKYGTPESHEKYRKLLLDWQSNEEVDPQGDRAFESAVPVDLTITELVARYVEHARSHYQRDGEPSKDYFHIVMAMRRLRELHGSHAARKFGPLALRSFQEYLVRQECRAPSLKRKAARDGKPVRTMTRTYVNRTVNLVRRMFKWAASMELVSPNMYQALKCVDGLRAGQCPAREAEPRRPVPEEDFLKSLKAMSPIVANICQLIKLTGARPSEILSMRPGDIDRTSLRDVWLFQPRSHKNEWRGKPRVICLGARCQGIVTPYLFRAPDSFCFSPRQATEERRAQMRVHRRTRVQPSQQDRRRQNPKKSPGDSYTHNSLNQAVRKACLRAGVRPWTPYQLRHSRAHELRSEFGVDAAAATLGHSRIDMTEHYSSRDISLAIEVARKSG